MRKKKVRKNKKKFNILAEIKALQKKLSRQNPGFDSVKALREMREGSLK